MAVVFLFSPSLGVVAWEGGIEENQFSKLLQTSLCKMDIATFLHFLIILFLLSCLRSGGLVHVKYIL